MTRISVIMAVYNTHQYLPDAIQSVLKQSLREIELLCVDDGSLNNSQVVFHQFAKKNSQIGVFAHKNERSAYMLSMAQYLIIKEQSIRDQCKKLKMLPDASKAQKETAIVSNISNPKKDPLRQNRKASKIEGFGNRYAISQNTFALCICSLLLMLVGLSLLNVKLHDISIILGIIFFLFRIIRFFDIYSSRTC